MRMMAQFDISIEPFNQGADDTGVARWANCLTDIYMQMSQNKLKLNAHNTEVLVLPQLVL